jgi:hypothetical protein
MVVLVIVVFVAVFVRVRDAVVMFVHVRVTVIVAMLVIVFVFTHMRFASRAHRRVSRYDSERRIVPLRYVRLIWRATVTVRLVAYAAAICGASLIGCSGGAAVSPGAVSASAGGSATMVASPKPTTQTTPSPLATSAPTTAPASVATGPALDVAPSLLAASLTCEPGVTNATRAPVLLVPGTTLIPSVNFDWNYERAFDADGIPWCAVTLPENAMGDIQTAGEYIVSAIRTMTSLAHRKIDILGYSQGGMVPRWAFRFWPDTRADVDAFVALDPSNHGTLDAYPVCAAGCAAAFWQQQSGSHFLTALNSGGETFAGISYTVVYSLTDEVVVPNEPAASSSSLSTGTGAIANIAVQSICPTDVSEHLAMGSYDPVGYALAYDAFTHGGLAEASRVPLSTCTMLYQPGVDPSTFVQNDAAYDAYVANTIATTPFISAEPTLAPYASGS